MHIIYCRTGFRRQIPVYTVVRIPNLYIDHVPNHGASCKSPFAPTNFSIVLFLYCFIIIQMEHAWAALLLNLNKIKSLRRNLFKLCCKINASSDYLISQDSKIWRTIRFFFWNGFIIPTWWFVCFDGRMAFAWILLSFQCHTHVPGCQDLPWLLNQQYT